MIGADPDSPPKLVTLPAAWDDAAAAALAALVPGGRPVALAAAAEDWIRPIAERALRRRDRSPAGGAAASAAAAPPRRADRRRSGSRSRRDWSPGFVLNLASFHDPTSGFDAAGFCRGGRDRGHRADLGGTRGAAGSPWAWPISPACWPRSVSTTVPSLPATWPRIAGCHPARPGEAASGALARRFGPVAPASRDWPAPPVETPLAGLAEAARAAGWQPPPRMDCATAH